MYYFLWLQYIFYFFSCLLKIILKNPFYEYVYVCAQVSSKITDSIHRLSCPLFFSTFLSFSLPPPISPQHLFNRSNRPRVTFSQSLIEAYKVHSSKKATNVRQRCPHSIEFLPAFQPFSMVLWKLLLLHEWFLSIRGDDTGICINGKTIVQLE